jgi:hypothetical protein
MLRNILYLFLLLLMACGEKQKTPKQAMAGKLRLGNISGVWLLTKPDFIADTYVQEQVLERYRDSLEAAHDLKMVACDADHGFWQLTTYDQKTPGDYRFLDGQLVFDNGGRHFNPLKGWVFVDADSCTISLKQVLRFAKTDSISVDWILRPVLDDSLLMVLQNDRIRKWLRKPDSSEALPTIKLRVENMLRFYGAYMRSLSSVTDYFRNDGVPLPFNFYAHGLGFKKLSETPAMANYFFDEANTKMAYAVLDKAFDRTAGIKKYPDGKDYTEEYGLFFIMLADAIKSVEIKNQ